MQDEPAIFISYRRRDAGGHARALHDYLSRRFGDDRVFFDRSTIESGDVFPDTLRQGVERCAVLLMLIGPEWLEVRGDDGGRRLDDADDFVRREITLALELGKTVIPVLFDDTPVPPRDRLPDPLKALASCDALTLRGKTYEYQTQRRELVRLLTKVPGVPPPRPEAPQVDSNRDRMLAEVRRVWIDGYLKHSLDTLVRIELGLEETPDAVSRPWDLVVQQPDQAPRPLPHGQAIGATFDELGQALLILGAQGSGKTTLLLELTRDLLDRAMQDPTHPIPVVFHLSSWAVRRRPLADWLVDELTKRYYVPRKLAQAWTDTEQVLPLLDGLDEVAPEHRTACIEAINTFRRRHPLVPLAVCSRVADYQALPVRVELAEAVVIQPLSRAQIRSYLRQAGKSLAGVRAVLRDDDTLWELLETPLMLSVVVLAYEGRSAAEVRATGSLEQRRTRLFETYTRRMFERRTKVTAYTPEQTERWLAWLARSLMRNNLSLFYVEWMQPDWLSSGAQRWIVAIVPIIISGLVVGLAVRLGMAVVVALTIALSFVAFSLRNTSNRIESAEALRWSWREAQSLCGEYLSSGLGYGLFSGLVIGLIAGLGIGLGFGKNGELATELSSRLVFGLVGGLGYGLFFGLVVGLVRLVGGLGYGLFFGLVVSPISGLVVGLFLGLIHGMIAGLESDQIVTRISPNEGIRRSLQNALVSLAIGLVFGVVFVLIMGLIFGLVVSPISGLGFRFVFLELGGLGDEHHVAGLLFGLIFGLFFGLKNGGFAYFKHYVLRFLLWRNGYAPWNYIRFLDYAAERLFLRKVGGGYIFTHRLLTEYFVTLQPTDQTRQAQAA